MSRKPVADSVATPASTRRAKQRAEEEARKTALRENMEKAGRHFAARRRVRGEEQIVTAGYMLSRPVHERWMLRAPAGGNVTVIDGEVRRTIVIATRAAYDARQMARQYMISKGQTYDETEALELIRWFPNGEIPKHVALVSRSDRGELVEEIFDFELTHE